MSLQLLQSVKKGHSSISKRKSFAIITAALVAGGGLAYATSSLFPRRSQQGSYNSVIVNGSDGEKDKSLQDAKFKSTTQKGGQKKVDLKSINALTGILVSRMGGKGIRSLFSLAIVLVLRTALSNRLAKLQGFLFRAAFVRRLPLFLRLITENFLLCLLQSGCISTAKYFTGILSLQFRKILTDCVHADYFQNMTYYRMSHVHGRVTNPEQRIVSDIPKFCSQLSDLICDDLTAVFDGLLYTWRLCSYASPKYLFYILGYVTGVGLLIGKISPSFGKLMSKEQQLEGDYRQLHSRLRSNSESIALYGGQDREASHVKQQFKTLVKHISLVQHTNWWFGMIQDFFLKYLGATCALVLIIEPFFAGSLRPDDSTLGRAEMLSNLRYHTSVIISLFHSLGTLFSSSRRLNRLSGYADRIRELMLVAKELRTSGGRYSIINKGGDGSFTEANHIEFDAVKVVTPTGNTLVENLTLKVEPGSNLLITGPNGSGKSSLFRVLGGLWPLVSGRITKPGVGSDLNNEIFYVPQRPYTAFGTLREQLIYPLTASEETKPLTDEGMRELLRNVDLEYLFDRYPTEKEINWGDELSLGEQQRLGMARLFYHKPKFAILDECTSAVTTDMEERFCEKVRAMGTSCITISHRPALVAFHDTVLSLDGEGGWVVSRRECAAQLRSLNEHSLAVENANSERKSDALTIQRVFDSVKAEIKRSDSNLMDPYVGEILAKSLPKDSGEPLLRVPHLTASPRNMATRIATLSKILVPTLNGKQGAQFAAVALLVMSRTWISDRIASLNGTSVKYVLKQDKAGFIHLVGISVLQSAASSVVAPSLRFLTAILHLGWRIRLTNHLSKCYFSKNAFYKVFHLSDKMIDADQRISTDVDKLSDDLSGLVTGMVKPIVDILWFTWRMKTLTGRRGVMILYAYMLLGLGFLRSVTPDFESLTSNEQQLESTFRFMHARLRSHAESVAFFGGGSREQATVERKFRDLLKHSECLLKKKWLFGIVDEFVTKQLPHNVTWALSLMYAMGHKGDRALTSVQGELAHALRFLASVVSQSFLAFGDVLELYGKFQELTGGISRIMELDELLDAGQQDGDSPLPNPLMLIEERRQAWRYSKEQEAIFFADVDIVTPAQKLLVSKLTFCVTPQKSLLITGPNGSGKSSVIRVLRGLWPIASGIISRPHQIEENADLSSFVNEDVFYVPQRPYTALGTLRDQIIYPLTLSEAISKISQGSVQDIANVNRNPAEELDQHLRNILESIRLLYLLEREGGWDASSNWEDMLSLGEQQRLGMARLFFHNPKFGILDECTNATSIDVEEHLYRYAQSLGITVVTISQRPALIPFHAMELRLIDGEGNWELRSIKC